MLGSMQISPDDEPSNAFLGVRFVLFGFDSVREDQVRLKLLEGRGIDAVNYGSECTHVVVDKLVYDDPICAAARRDGKILVSGLWVNHSFDVGMHVDPTSVMYRPVRDLNGIRGAKSLVMCLTGYQRQDRDDIMTMVALMGANFSKPLVANKVTHLICYKFEGEKYELGRKVKTIKLVNHHWLQDCLMAWELLPEADYAKSAYELEMEAEAKDSEEETEDMASADQQKKSIVSPQNAQVGNKNFHLSTSVQEVSRDSAYLTAFESLATVGNTSKAKSTPTKETDTSNSSCARSPAKLPSKVPSNGPDGKLISEKIDHGLASTSGNAKKSVDGGLPKLTSKNMKASLPLRSERLEKNSCSPLSNVNKPGVDVPPERQLGWPDSHGIRTPLKGILLHSDEGQNVGLHSTKKRTISRGSSRSPVLSHSPKTSLKSGFATKQIETPVSRSLIDVAYDVSPASCLREEVSDGFVMQSEKDQDGVKTPLKRDLVDLMEEPPSSLPGNKKTTVSRGGSKSTKGRRSPKILMGSGSDIKQTELLVSGSSVHGSRQLAVDVLPTNISGSSREESCVFLRQPERDQDGVKTPLKGALLHPNEQISSLDSKKKMNGSSKSEKVSRSPKPSMGSGLDIKATDTSSDLREEDSIFSKEALSISALRENSLETNDAMLQYSQGRSKKHSLPDLDVNDPSSSRTRPCSGEEEMQQSNQPPFPCTSSRVDKLGGQVDDNGSKPVKKKMLARKTLGSRPTICKGRNTKHKGLISTVLQNEFTSQSNGELVTKNTNNVSLVEKLVAVSPTTNDDVPVGEGIDAVECEGPNESFEIEVKSSVVVEEPTHKRKQPSENTTQIKKGAKSKVVKSNEPKKSLCSQKMELPESKSTGDVAEGKIKAAKSKTNKLKETKQDQKKIVSCNEEVVNLAGKTIKKPCKKLKGSDDVEKENGPITSGQHSGNSHNLKKPLRNACIPHKANAENLNMKAEPACFILSGHRLQRKEFQQVIRRLKGRACRDTHNWSYQATHFIVPDPIRRTEKFFAAAASGSWILKTDYLTASNEAGRFLSEEPYEWHKKSLTEDGAINLEAPRKWRRLRERTGHGAFYGIRIIIYGECIAPPLETLKRAVMAGDGTIVATSPPYTRALKSKVDFAVVSPGTPRVDMWVQEFVRHEIACVSADYLVEYVCKPGHSLERHVMYNTQAWAERSLESLVSRLEEAVDDPKTPEYDDDASCQVCGMHDRGDEMLLCGDESGTYGCGVGTHIDCLDPPLTDVPEEDWFCGECCRSSINR